MNKDLPQDYALLFSEVKARVLAAQYAALRSVNKELISLYCDIGRLIVERQQGGSWGKSVVEQLAADLRLAFPGVRGFSIQNVWYMRQFYLAYSGEKKLQPLVGEVSRAKNLLILSRCKEALEREFYLKMTRKQGWTKALLALHLENQSYEKTLLGQTNFIRALPSEIAAQAKLAVQDEYTFDFLELGAEHSERELERALVGKVEHFLRAMGGLFAFLGSQYRLEVDGREFFVDLLLFHRRLKCFVAVDLKIGEFEPEFVGKMQFYLAALDSQTKLPDENPSIGIILCKAKRRAIVEYAPRDAKKPIGVAIYRTLKKLPRELKGQLPSPEEISRLLDEV